MIEIRKARKQFGTQVVFENLDLTINKGESVFVIGKSGTGKSVLLKSIVGLLKLDAGEVWLDGNEISALPEDKLHPVRKKCGYLFQQPALLDSLTIYENLAFGLRAHRICETEEGVGQRIRTVLDAVHVGDEWLNCFPPELSFGLQKRVSVARALSVDPEYLLFDEPTTGLDPVLTRLITEMISELSKSGRVTSVVVSHDLQCAFRAADRIVLLDNGGVTLDVTPLKFQASTHPLAQAFVREAKERMYVE